MEVLSDHLIRRQFIAVNPKAVLILRFGTVRGVAIGMAVDIGAFLEKGAIPRQKF